MPYPQKHAGTFLLALAAATQLTGSQETGRQFVGVTDFTRFTIEMAAPDLVRLISPVFQAGLEFDQLIVSWNAAMPPGAWMKIEAQPHFGDRPGHFYTLGYWSTAPAPEARRSVSGQINEEGEVRTDLLVLAHPAQGFRIRLTLAPNLRSDAVQLKFLGIALLDSNLPLPASASPDSPPVGPLPVPTRSQMDYPGGGAWCSPTSLSMVLSYWAAVLSRPDLERDVPEVAAAVSDPAWPGTGNWPFNTAYAGSFPGMRAYVSRLGSLEELQSWIAAGVPVVTSITYSVLKGRTDQNDGHLVVVVGFDEKGNVTLNDPGTRHSMRKTVPRERFTSAWSKSHNTVYLVHPADHPTPAARDGHWHQPPRQ